MARICLLGHHSADLRYCACRSLGAGGCHGSKHEYQHSADIGGSQKSGTSTSAGNIRGEQIFLRKMGTTSEYSRTPNLHDGPRCYSSEGRTAHFRRLDVLETTQRGGDGASSFSVQLLRALR